MKSDFIGNLNRLVRFFAKLESVDKFGAISYSEKDIAQVWASIKVLSNSPWYDYGKKNNSINYKIVCRYLKDIKVGNFIDLGNAKVEIQSVIHKDDIINITEIIAVDKVEK